jgi:hypothetical protein
MFRKLKNHLMVDQYAKIQEQMSYGKIINNEFKGIKYFIVNTPSYADVYNFIPAEYRKDFYLSLMLVNDHVPPHTDSGINSTINFYIKTENCQTQFYKFKSTDPAKVQVDNQTDGYIFDIDDLEATESFTAQAGEVWVLDVTQPHGVVSPGTITERVAIALSTKLKFDQVCDILESTGNL